MLKHEPSEASKVQLLIPKAVRVPEAEAVFQQVDVALRGGHNDEARRLADMFVLQSLLPLERERIIVTLERALGEARRRRRPAKGDDVEAPDG